MTAVTAADQNTVMVEQSNTPVEIPWRLTRLIPSYTPAGLTALTFVCYGKCSG